MGREKETLAKWKDEEKKKPLPQLLKGELDEYEQELAAEPKAKGLKSPAQEHLLVG